MRRCSISLIMKVKSLSCVQLFATPWIVACPKLLRPWDFQGKSTGVGCHFLLQGTFPTQGSNPGLSHCRQTLYHLSHQGTNHEGNAKPQWEITSCLLGMPIIEKVGENTCWQGCGEKEALLPCWWGCKLVWPLQKIVWRPLKNLKAKPPYDPAILLLRRYPKEMKIITSKTICTPMFEAALFMIVKTRKQPKYPFWIHGSSCGVYITGCYAATKKMRKSCHLW